MQLVIETALTACSVALIDGDQCMAERHEEIGRGHAERLIPMIDELLADAGGREVTSILVDVGPGSFTGLRVGVAAAKAFGLAWALPVHGVTSTALVAAGAFAAHPMLDNLYVALDAARGQVYTQGFGRTGPTNDVQALDPADAVREAEAHSAMAGSGTGLLAGLNAGLTAVPPLLPRASDARYLPAGYARPVAPLYVRAPDARLPA
jgi:tRNA threonylcarbamoyladenosine biosynthesis protein TsaB